MLIISIKLTEVFCSFSDLLEMSDLNLLVQELSSVKEKWHDIGKEFGFTPSLSDIRVQYSDHIDCLREILRRQLQYDTTTWRNIVDALRSPCVHEAQLADQLQAKFCPSEFINNTTV